MAPDALLLDTQVLRGGGLGKELIVSGLLPALFQTLKLVLRARGYVAPSAVAVVSRPPFPS